MSPKACFGAHVFDFKGLPNDLKETLLMHHQYIQFYLDNKYSLSRYYDVKK